VDPELEVVGEAADGLDAISCAQRFTPDVILMDLSMPKMNGLEAMREIKRLSPDTKILVLTVHKNEEYILASFQAGADGYVLKDASHHELIAAVKTVMQG
jgi:DNA-binding NarL/FixJ family response regulator